MPVPPCSGLVRKMLDLQLVTPWLRVNSNYTAINVEKETIDPNSVLNFYKKLIALRKEKDIIVYGEFEPLCREDDQILHI